MNERPARKAHPKINPDRRTSPREQINRDRQLYSHEQIDRGQRTSSREQVNRDRQPSSREQVNRDRRTSPREQDDRNKQHYPRVQASRDRQPYPHKQANHDLQSYPHEQAEPAEDNLILEGRKAVLEALNHQKPVDKLLLRRDRDKPLEGTLRLIAAKARDAGVVVQEVERARLDLLSETGRHQGVIAVCPAKEYVEIEDMLTLAAERNEAPFIVILDGVTDPHNLGAVLRTAEAGGAHGVVIPKRRAVGLTGTVAKTSAGAIEHMAVARVTNIVRTLEELKNHGLWIACADMDGDSLYTCDLSGPIALVVGAEGSGVSRLVMDKADFKVKIPMLGKIASLNASVAAGILIYEIVRGRREGAR